MSVDIEGINKKLAGMTRRLILLQPYRTLTFEEYLEDEARQATIERFLELIIQGAIDINKMLLKQVTNIKLTQGNESLTNAEIFVLAGEYGFIPQQLAQQLSASGRFRNVLAHLYDEIMPEKTYEALQKAFEQYPQYIAAIQNYLDSLEIDDEP
ncbi:type VII toxin-antitoxin system HepT family RNase toxin [Pantanalinema rosaneae CENA516]|uniref:type VII toxin-antitoxin system HepT family RNase toxin n=1 Tax=Pantanalinema rosaneae TaxID=1620701 RepID=UPI003D6F7A2B